MKTTQGRMCIARNCGRRFDARDGSGLVKCVDGVMVAQAFADRYCEPCNDRRPWVPIIEEIPGRAMHVEGSLGE